MIFRCGGYGDFLFQRQAFTGFELLVGKHVAQRGVRHAQVAVIHIACIFEFQRQGNGAIFHHALDIAGQIGGQRSFPIRNGLVFHGIGLCFRFSFGLVGNGGAAGQVLLAHGDGIAHLGSLARLQQRNGLLFLVDILIFFNGHIREADGTAVGDVIAYHHLLALSGHGGADGALDVHIGFGRLQRDGRANGLALVHSLAAVLIEGVFDKVNHGAVFQRAVVDVIGTGPCGAFPRLEQHRAIGAEIGHDLRRGVVEHDRVLHIGVARIGDGDGHVNCAGRRQLVGVQLHAAHDGVYLGCDGSARQQHQRRRHQAQDQSLAFCHACWAEKSALPPFGKPTAYWYGRAYGHSFHMAVR